MRAAMSMMRFVLFGAVGFGIGWALAGALVLITDATLFHSVLLLSGALGGAALGLALRSWKKVFALALGGALGFGGGFYFMYFFLPFVTGHILASAMMGGFGGIVMGMAFGAPFMDWRSVVLLGFGGMVGFGIGGMIEQVLGIYLFAPPEELPPFHMGELYVGVQAAVGLIGGACLGAALGYLQQRKQAVERRPRVR